MHYIHHKLMTNVKYTLPQIEIRSLILNNRGGTKGHPTSLALTPRTSLTLGVARVSTPAAPSGCRAGCNLHCKVKTLGPPRNTARSP